MPREPRNPGVDFGIVGGGNNAGHAIDIAIVESTLDDFDFGRQFGHPGTDSRCDDAHPAAGPPQQPGLARGDRAAADDQAAAIADIVKNG